MTKYYAGPCDAELAAMAAAWAAVFAWQQQGVALLQAANASSLKAWECLQKHAGVIPKLEHTTEIGRAQAMTMKTAMDVDRMIKSSRASVQQDVACIQSGVEHIKRLVPRGPKPKKVSEGM